MPKFILLLLIQWLSLVEVCHIYKCNHGVCYLKSPLIALCKCHRGYTGDQCDQVDNCIHHPCVHGTCTNTVSGYNCTCYPAYTGTNCGTDCRHQPCIHGKCINHHNAYSCSCDPGYHGKTCNHLNTNVTPVPTTHMPTTHVPTTSTKSVLKTTAKVSFTCADDAAINCQNPQVCSSQFKDKCPVSCGICVPVTASNCQDNPLVNCQNTNICQSNFGVYCPVTCGKCGTVNLQTTTKKTTLGWFQITNSG